MKAWVEFHRDEVIDLAAQLLRPALDFGDRVDGLLFRGRSQLANAEQRDDDNHHTCVFHSNALHRRKNPCKSSESGNLKILEVPKFPLCPQRRLAMNTITTASTNTILAVGLGKYKSVACVHDQAATVKRGRAA